MSKESINELNISLQKLCLPDAASTILASSYNYYVCHEITNKGQSN